MNPPVADDGFGGPGAPRGARPASPDLEISFGGHGTAPGRLNFSGMIAIDADRTVWVADFGNNRIQAFSPDGAFMNAFGTGGAAPGMLNAPNDVAVDAHGRIWVADTDNMRIQVFDPDGTLVGHVAMPGVGADALPSSVTIHGEELYVTRFTNPDILVYRILPPDE